MARTALLVLRSAIVFLCAGMAKIVSQSQHLGAKTRESIVSPMKWRQRIYRGKAAAPHGFPWTVVLKEFGKVPSCGGVLIRDPLKPHEQMTDIILTAAHCLDMEKEYLEQIIVYAGVHSLADVPDGLQTRSIKFFILGDGYKPRTLPKKGGKSKRFSNFKGDIAVVRLDSPIVFSETVQPIDLPTQDQQLNVNEIGLVAGWGYENDKKRTKVVELRYAEFEVISGDDCKRNFGSFEEDSMICGLGVKENSASSSHSTVDSPSSSIFKKLKSIATKPPSDHPSACGGDSGSPYFFLKNGTFTLHGLVVAAGEDCTKGAPVVFSRIASRVAWIAHQVQLLKQAHHFATTSALTVKQKRSNEL